MIFYVYQIITPYQNLLEALMTFQRSTLKLLIVAGSILFLLPLRTYVSGFTFNFHSQKYKTNKLKLQTAFISILLLLYSVAKCKK